MSDVYPVKNTVERSGAKEKKELSPFKKRVRRGYRNRSVPTRYGTAPTHKSKKTFF